MPLPKNMLFKNKNKSLTNYNLTGMVLYNLQKKGEKKDTNIVAQHYP